MAKQEFKFKITLKELSIECEGSRDVGQAFQAEVNRTVGALVNAQRRAMDAVASPAPQPRLFDDDGPVEPTQNGHAANGHAANGHAAPLPASPPPPAAVEKAKKPRKSGGETAMSLLRGLIAEDYFKEARTMDDIRDKLRLGGHTNPAGLSARLPELAKKKELYRAENADGYIYKDTPFNDAPATPAPPVEPDE